MDAVAHFEAVQAVHLWLLPALMLTLVTIPWPRRFWIRCLLAVLVGWAYYVAFTTLVYNPAGIAAAHALGEHFPENRYDNNTTGVALVFGWIQPALFVGLYALARLGWLRIRRRGA